MQNYHTDIIWSIDAALFGISLTAAVLIFACALVKDHLWKKRRDALLRIKKNVYDLILAGKGSSAPVCRPFKADITPEQFIDIETNRKIEMAFFNEAERQFFRSCFVNPEQVAKLEKIALKSVNKWRRIEAILSLGYVRVKSATDLLKKTLMSKDRDVAYFSIIALGQTKTADVARSILELLPKDPLNGHKIVSILQDFPKDIAADVVKLVDHYDPVVRYWAVTLLSRLSPSAYIERIIKLTGDTSHDVRSAACSCLGEIKSAESKKALLKCLNDDNWLVKSRAISALSRSTANGAVPEIAGLIKDPSWSVVEAVKEAMVAHIDASLPYIEKYLFGDDEIARKYSIYALQDSGYIPKLLKDAVSGPDKGLSARILKGLVKAKARFGLEAALNSLDPDTRAGAEDIIRKMEEE